MEKLEMFEAFNFKNKINDAISKIGDKVENLKKKRKEKNAKLADVKKELEEVMTNLDRMSSKEYFDDMAKSHNAFISKSGSLDKKNKDRLAAFKAQLNDMKKW